jgi:anti-sigma factor RsiW
MARPSGEKLLAYFDGVLDPAERDVVARWLEHDLGVRLRGAARGSKIVDLTAERAAQQLPVAARRRLARRTVAASRSAFSWAPARVGSPPAIAAATATATSPP